MLAAAAADLFFGDTLDFGETGPFFPFVAGVFFWEMAAEVFDAAVDVFEVADDAAAAPLVIGALFAFVYDFPAAAFSR